METPSVFLWSGGHGSYLCTTYHYIVDAVLIRISKYLRQIVVPWVKAFQMTFMYPLRLGIFWTLMLIIKTVSVEFFSSYLCAFFQSFSQWNVMGWNPTRDLVDCRMDAIFCVSGKAKASTKTARCASHTLREARVIRAAPSSRVCLCVSVTVNLHYFKLHRSYSISYNLWNVDGYFCSWILKDSSLVLLVQKRRQKICLVLRSYIKFD